MSLLQDGHIYFFILSEWQTLKSSLKYSSQGPGGLEIGRAGGRLCVTCLALLGPEC